MLKDITLGQYFPGESIVHKLATNLAENSATI